MAFCALLCNPRPRDVLHLFSFILYSYVSTLIWEMVPTRLKIIIYNQQNSDCVIGCYHKIVPYTTQSMKMLKSTNNRNYLFLTLHNGTTTKVSHIGNKYKKLIQIICTRLLYSLNVCQVTNKLKSIIHTRDWLLKPLSKNRYIKYI